tara:strand:+ start:165 stop:380 length:216 start_codon:yes stop_codon:yes gene_type:complete
MNIYDEKFFKALIIIFLILLIFIFSFIAFNLLPIMNWANYQTICIEQESIDKTIPWAVRKCNGRSKVYQVK